MKKYERETSCSLKVSFEKHNKTIAKKEEEKSCITNYIWSEKSTHYLLWDVVHKIDKEHH